MSNRINFLLNEFFVEFEKNDFAVLKKNNNPFSKITEIKNFKSTLWIQLKTAVIIFEIIKHKTGYTRKDIQGVSKKGNLPNARAAFAVSFLKIYPYTDYNFITDLLGGKDRTMVNSYLKKDRDLQSSVNKNDHVAIWYHELTSVIFEFFFPIKMVQSA